MPARKVLLVFAHPAYERAKVNPALARAAMTMDGVSFHDLYETYPDFLIDVEAEQRRLVEHDVLVLQFPFFWYSVPALLKEWIDLVFLHGFAYGQGGTALAGKSLLCALTTGGEAKDYEPGGDNRFTVAEFLRPLEQTARLCGMRWAKPFVVHGSSILAETEVAAATHAYWLRLTGFVDGTAD